MFKNVIVAVLFSIKMKIPMQRLKSYISLYIEGGLIALVEDNDQIEINTLNNTLNLNVSCEVIEERRKRWMKPQAKARSGLLFKYTQSVKNASEGCVTNEPHHEAFQLVLTCQI
ncbi:hypothetical protein FNW52_17440 [Flavobacterium sp. ZT3R18]|uniref:dihydroxy-acid dehydratase domain-containing protein n=1 Tax=Flavobacterium sp. ZT3R18 TaxID=2594429 RepID=UPI00117A9A59|nr:dihydroxy-acid dehydratase [Flavobacterium sp. ZT3R18]TRX32218.1 hypothetical protein FNW52_17440 [Flavobacterium sp. ZT3R18]